MNPCQTRCARVNGGPEPEDPGGQAGQRLEGRSRGAHGGAALAVYADDRLSARSNQRSIRAALNP